MEKSRKSRKYDRRISIPLMNAEAAHLALEVRRSGLSVCDYRRIALLSGLPETFARRETDCWEEETLADIQADVKRLLRQQLHWCDVDESALLNIMDRLEALQSRRERRAGWLT